MTEIEALLARLKELDPETWNCYQHRLAPLRDTPCDMRRGKIITLSILQGVIQEAISDPGRGWTLITEFPVKDGMWWSAEIMEKASGIGRIRIGPTAAEAILAAYVAMLEAGR